MDRLAIAPQSRSAVRTLLGLGALAFLAAFARQHPGVRESGLWRLAAAGSWLADAACLWLALAAAGVQLDPDVVLLAYVAGIMISALPLLPGGIGAVEAAIPALLHHFGAPLDAALAGTLVHRGISMLLPAAAGALLIALAPTAHTQPALRPQPHGPRLTPAIMRPAA